MGIAEVFTLAKALGIAPAQAATLFESFNPWYSIAARTKRMLDANFSEPSWELGMARRHGAA